jgi:beta-lactamase regulating signal transducer with metallopeptidase domain
MQALANPLVSSMATAFVSSLWQGMVIACALSLCMKLAPRISAAARFAVWAAGFVAAVCLPAFPLISHFASRTNQVAVAAGLAEGVSRPLLQLDLRWSAVIVGLWAAAATFRAVDLAIHSLRLRMLWKSAAPLEIGEKLAGILTEVGRARVQICSTKAPERPSVIGFFAPRILIPDWLLGRLTPEELEQVVLHEAQHLRRNDDWTNLAQKLLMVVFPLNPALWWMERKLCREREMACDEGVVRVTHAPRAYAACLASLAERGLRQRVEALSLGAWQRRPELVHRVHGILLRKPTLRPVASAALLGAFGCGLVAGSVELARCPQLVAFVPAQKAEAAHAGVATEKNTVAYSAQGDAVFADKRNLAPGFHAVEAKAVTPAVHPALANTQPKGGMSKIGSAIASETASKVKPIAAAKTDKSGALNTDQTQQQWIVFTSVEQIGAAGRSEQLTADFDPHAGGDAVMNDSTSNNERNDQVRSQITITRLILRILPPTSFPAQPDPVSLRNGWFVIQL